jgi:hypothetical protein
MLDTLNTLYMLNMLDIEIKPFKHVEQVDYFSQTTARCQFMVVFLTKRTMKGK